MHTPNLLLLLLTLLPPALTSGPKCCAITGQARDYHFNTDAQARFDADATALCKDQIYSTPFSMRESCEDWDGNQWYVVCDNANNVANEGNSGALHYSCQPSKTECVTCPPRTTPIPRAAR